MEHWHEVERGLACARAIAAVAEAGVVGDAAVVQHRAFGKTRGAGRVLDLHRIGWLHVRQLDGGVLARIERGRVFEVDHLTERRDPACDLRSDLRHRIAAVLTDDEQASRARLLKHELQLAGAIGRIGRHQHETGEAGGILQDYPFGDVRRPDGDPLAGPVA